MSQISISGGVVQQVGYQPLVTIPQYAQFQIALFRVTHLFVDDTEIPLPHDIVSIFTSPTLIDPVVLAMLCRCSYPLVAPADGLSFWFSGTYLGASTAGDPAVRIESDLQVQMYVMSNGQMSEGSRRSPEQRIVEFLVGKAES